MRTKIVIFAVIMFFIVLNLMVGCTKEESRGEVTIQSSPYIDRVYEYLPAPGQYINTLPTFEEGFTQEDMIALVESQIAGVGAGSIVTLGGYGGYVTFGFDHMVENRSGLRDLRIYGNKMATSSEPGVIMVSMDLNENGVPDDEWFEIKGSAHDDDATISNYEITYYRSADEDATPYIIWRDNQGEEGSIEKNAFHTQSYFAEWIDSDSLSFSGTRLPDVAENQGVDGAESWVMTGFEYGYADNGFNADESSAIDIDWAVDHNGETVYLEGINFVRVYSGVNQVAGWLGELSTEICGAEDLHLLGIEIAQ